MFYKQVKWIANHAYWQLICGCPKIVSQTTSTFTYKQDILIKLKAHEIHIEIVFDVSCFSFTFLFLMIPEAETYSTAWGVFS